PWRAVCGQTFEVGTVCVSSASTGLCGGQRVIAVPTVTRTEVRRLGFQPLNLASLRNSGWANGLGPAAEADRLVTLERHGASHALIQGPRENSNFMSTPPEYSVQCAV